MKFPKVELNIPNFLSLLRIILIPVFIYMLAQKNKQMWIAALIVFLIASFTDLLDGWSARKLKQESEFGQFLDPLADKVLVVCALIAILLLDQFLSIVRDFWMIIVIVGRDVMITVMRTRAIKLGKPLKTSRFGKIKTAFQMGSVVIIIMIYILRNDKWLTKLMNLNVEWLNKAPYWIMFVVTLLTAFSGLRYLISNYNLLFPKAGSRDEQS